MTSPSFGVEMGQGYRHGVGGIGGRLLIEAQEPRHHVAHMLLLGGPVADERCVDVCVSGV